MSAVTEWYAVEALDAWPAPGRWRLMPWGQEHDKFAPTDTGLERARQAAAIWAAPGSPARVVKMTRHVVEPTPT